MIVAYYWYRLRKVNKARALKALATRQLLSEMSAATADNNNMASANCCQQWQQLSSVGLPPTYEDLDVLKQDPPDYRESLMHQVLLHVLYNFIQMSLSLKLSLLKMKMFSSYFLFLPGQRRLQREVRIRWFCGA